MQYFVCPKTSHAEIMCDVSTMLFFSMKFSTTFYPEALWAMLDLP